jgi:CHAT domain-containing protein
LFVATTEANTGSPSGSRKRFPRASNTALVVKAYPLAVKPAEIAVLTSRFLQLIGSRDPSSAEVARELYHVLFAPAEQQIATKSRLIIIPDGVVWDVPFAALQPAENQYLVDQKTLSYAISISAFKEMRKPRAVRRVAAATVLAFGNPTLADDVLERIKTTYKGLELRQMPAESEEIEQLQTIYGKTRSHVYTGARATEERVKTEANGYSSIHFATPTILDHSVPLYSSVVLSADPKVPDDGLLRLWEVINLNSKAKIAVVPSVAFAQTQSRSANALMAMSWAWFVAGTPTVMMSRWNVDAPIVLEFASGLHRNLRSRKRGQNSNAEALRNSVLKLRGSPGHENPHDWSGFMVMGDP